MPAPKRQPDGNPLHRELLPSATSDPEPRRHALFGRAREGKECEIPNFKGSSHKLPQRGAHLYRVLKRRSGGAMVARTSSAVAFAGSASAVLRNAAKTAATVAFWPAQAP